MSYKWAPAYFRGFNCTQSASKVLGCFLFLDGACRGEHVSVSGPGGWLQMGGWELHHYEVKVYCRETQLSSGQGGTTMFCAETLDDTFCPT